MKAPRYLALMPVLLLSACATPTIEAPVNAPVEVAVPDAGVSTINLPVTIDLDALRAEVLRRVPSPLVTGSTTQVVKVNMQPAAASKSVAAPPCNDNSLSCMAEKAKIAATVAANSLPAVNFVAPVETQITHQVFLRDLNMRMNGNQFVVDVTADFSIATRINSPLTTIGVASCGVNEAMPRIQFTLPGTVKWGDKGVLNIVKGQWALKWLKPCSLTALNLNAESILNLPLVRSKVEEAISSAIETNMGAVGLKPILEKAWPAINEPREVQPGVWMVLNPQQVGFADLVGQGKTISTAIFIAARPQIVSGAKPALKLPPVPEVQVLPKSEGFHIALRGDVGLEKANELLNAQLANKPIDAGGKTVLIEKLRLYGSGEKAVIGLTLKQPVQAEIFLLAKPVFDAEKNEVRFEEVEYSLATSNVLLKSASWMLSGTFRKTIQEKAKFSFDQDLADQMSKLRNTRFDLGQGGAGMRLALDKVRPMGLWFTATEIKTIVVADGKVWLDYGVK